MSREEQFDFYWKEIFDGLPYNPIEFNVYRFDQSMSLPSKFNKLYDMFKQLALNNQEVMDYLKEFVETFDVKLYETIEDVLEVLLEDGRLAEVVRVAISEEVIEARTDYLGKKYANLKERLDVENEEITTQLAQITTFATDFGAKFNGVDDDVSAINIAIKHVGDNGGGKVILPKGTGVVSSSILMQSQVELIGQGRDVTYIKPTFTVGEVISAKDTHKQKPIVRDLTIKPDEYQYQLIAISYKYFQYGTVKRVDVVNCGISYDFNGEYGCYYNKQIQTRAISTGIGVRTTTNGTTTGNRPNANEITDITIISPIVAIENNAGNSNKFYDVKVESLESVAKHPIIQHDGTSKGKNDRWVLVNKGGYYNYFEKFRAEFAGNLVDLGSTYGSFLKDFFMNYNGVKDDFITLKEEPTSLYQTNDLDGVFLGYSLPVLTHTTYMRKNRLGYTPVLSPQVQFTPRDYSGKPIVETKKGHVQFGADGNFYVTTTDDNHVEKIAWDRKPTALTTGLLKFEVKTVDRPQTVITPSATENIIAYMTGIQKGDTVILNSEINIPTGLVVNPVYSSAGQATCVVKNITNANITLPPNSWTFTLIKP